MSDQSEGATSTSAAPPSLSVEGYSQGIHLRCSCGWVWVFDQNPVPFGQIGYQATEHTNAVHRSHP